MINFALVNVFLPSMHGTKLGFMRDILSEAKLFLRQNDVNHMEVPCYQEISVKNLYEDAMKDELLMKYLPTREQLSGRLPERDFFFGLLCTLPLPRAPLDPQAAPLPRSHPRPRAPPAFPAATQARPAPPPLSA